MEVFGIIGAGGFGREMYSVAALQLRGRIDAGFAKLVFVVEDGFPTSPVNGHEVLSFTHFSELNCLRHFSVAIADSGVRKRIADRAINAGMHPFDIVSPNSLILEGSTVGCGLILAPFSMITANSKIGDYFHANYYSCITHDCRVGDYVTLGPRAQCNGNVILEDHVYVGAGALIKQGSSERPLIIGAGAVIGMGSVVISDVAPRAVVVGNPARLLSRNAHDE